jgi:cytochrome c oxidase subunit 1
VLWQHFFWIFGHPEVYILMLPGFGAASHSGIRAQGDVRLLVMIAATARSASSASAWAHHMFVVGMSPAGNTFFVFSTMLIAVPTGIKIFNWLGTMWGGQIRFATPMLFCTAFLFQFLIAGLTGVMLASAPFDWQLSDSYFVVAHFHYVLIGGLLFTIFAAIYYWFPKVTGKLLDERLGKWHFWLFTIGFNLTFGRSLASRHAARIYTYERAAGELWNGSRRSACFRSPVALHGVEPGAHAAPREPAGDDPWTRGARVPTSPPPPYNFETIPVVRSRRPLWDLKHPDDPDWIRMNAAAETTGCRHAGGSAWRA